MISNNAETLRGKVLDDARKIFGRPLLGGKGCGRMNHCKLSVSWIVHLKAGRHLGRSRLRDRELGCRSIADRHAGPAQQRQLLLNRVRLVSSPKRRGRRRKVVM